MAVSRPGGADRASATHPPTPLLPARRASGAHLRQWRLPRRAHRRRGSPLHEQRGRRHDARARYPIGNRAGPAPRPHPSAVGLEARRGRGPSVGAPTGADRPGAPGRRTASRASPRNGPAAPPPRPRARAPARADASKRPGSGGTPAAPRSRQQPCAARSTGTRSRRSRSPASPVAADVVGARPAAAALESGRSAAGQRVEDRGWRPGSRGASAPGDPLTVPSGPIITSAAGFAAAR